MALKAYSLKGTLKKRKKNRPRRRSLAGDLVIGGTGAIIGLGFLGATTEAVGRI